MRTRIVTGCVFGFLGLGFLGLLAMAAAAPLAAQNLMRDPLTAAEANQVRGTASRLDKRVPLLLQFAAQRLASFERIRTASPRPPGRSSQLYALLQQYAEILPEFDDAVDDLAQGVTNSESPKHYNVPKVLTPVIAQLKQMDATLHHIQAGSSPADLATYRYQLEDCMDATGDSLQNAEQARRAALAAPQSGKAHAHHLF